jgi:hypothetical protein
MTHPREKIVLVVRFPAFVRGPESRPAECPRKGRSARDGKRTASRPRRAFRRITFTGAGVSTTLVLSLAHGERSWTIGGLALGVFAVLLLLTELIAARSRAS